jgi:hypothetical protein
VKKRKRKEIQENAKFKYLEIVTFDPPYAKKNPGSYDKHPIKIGDTVLYLGEIPNAPGHGAVVKYSGEVIWMIHPDEFRKATDEEL